jgi:GNAT superfamily N-acetyltransferase
VVGAAVIRAATVADAEALTDLHLDAWDEAYAGLVDDAILGERRRRRAERISTWRRIIAATTSTELVADDPAVPGRLVGFASTGPGRDDDPALPPCELMALYVRVERYDTGLGRALLTAALGDAPSYLWVLDGNERAIRFYERQGFVFDGATRADELGVELRMVRS